MTSIYEMANIKIKSYSFIFLYLLMTPICKGHDGTPVAPSEPAELPVLISADEGVEIFDKDHYVTAHANISMERADVSLYGDKLRADYQIEETGKRKLDKFDMSENFLMFSPQGTLYGDKGTYDLTKDTIKVIGRNLRLYTLQGEIKACDALIYHPNAMIAHAHGKAKVINRDSTQHLYGDHLTAYFKPADVTNTTTTQTPLLTPMKGNLRLEKITGDGNVKLILPNKVATSNRGTYYAEEDKFILEGNVKVTDENRQMNGEYATVNRATGVSKVWNCEPNQASPTSAPPAESTALASTQKSGPKKRVRALLLPDKK